MSSFKKFFKYDIIFMFFSCLASVSLLMTVAKIFILYAYYYSPNDKSRDMILNPTIEYINVFILCSSVVFYSCLAFKYFKTAQLMRQKK
jgi:heme/copper-type cytochrome/quinol oxidase subunit 2